MIYGLNYFICVQNSVTNPPLNASKADSDNLPLNASKADSDLYDKTKFSMFQHIFNLNSHIIDQKLFHMCWNRLKKTATMPAKRLLSEEGIQFISYR